MADAIRVLEGKGVREFYVYDSTKLPDEEWSAVLRPLDTALVFADTPLAGKARNGGFDGLYTYDVYMHSGGAFLRCAARHAGSGWSAHPRWARLRRTSRHR